MPARLLAAIFSLVLGWYGTAQGQAEMASDEDTVLLVAHPDFRDPGYFHTVLICAPITGGGHIGVILNRPTPKALISFFPEHEPSRKVTDPVRYGGPFGPGAVVAVVKADKNPGIGTLPLMKDLFIAFRAATIDKVIEETPNDARYFIGYVGWRPGELKTEIDRGVWSVLPANADTIFRKDLDGLWDEFFVRTRRLQASVVTPSQTPLRLSSSRP